MEQRSKFFQFLNYLIERKGARLLHLVSALMGIRVVMAMETTQLRVVAFIFAVIFLLASVFRKKTYLFYPLMTTSIILFTLLAILSKLDIFILLSLGNHFLINSAFLFPNPFMSILVAAVISSLLLTYQHSFSFYVIRSGISEVLVNFLFYSTFAYLIRYLFRKKLELQESEKSNQLLLSLLPDPLVIHQYGRIIFINQQGLKLVGASVPSEVVGKRIYDFILPEFHERVAEHLYSKTDSVVPMELKLCKLDNEIIDIDTTTALFIYNGKPAVISIIRDVTLLKSQTEELMQKSDKLSLVGQLAAGIAHEIRNPLTSLRGFIQLLQYKSEDNKEYCEIMLSELDRINLIVSEFLILAKPHMVHYSNRQVNEIISHVGTLIGTQAIMSNIHLEYKLAKNLPTVSCEENQLKQVLINLIKNAIEAMPNGGTVKVETGKYERNKIFIRVTDEGNGIPEDLLLKIGEPFFTTKSHGTGLGLMVCYKIIENHLGELKVQSELGKGTTFEIILQSAEDYIDVRKTS